VINISEENVKSILELIEELVLNSPKIPILNKLIIDEDKLFSLLDELNKNLPAEMSEAKVIVENKERLIIEANEKYDEIINDSEKKAQDILQVAESKSSNMVTIAESKANQMLNLSEKKSKELVESAQMRAKLMISDSEVLKKALVEANNIKSEAKKEIDLKNNEVYSYAESVLENLEGQLSSTINVIRNGRESLSK